MLWFMSQVMIWPCDGLVICRQLAQDPCIPELDKWLRKYHSFCIDLYHFLTFYLIT